MTLELLQELNNQDKITLRNMSPEARAFLETHGNSSNIQYYSYAQDRWIPDQDINWSYKNIRYRHTIVDELENKARIPFKGMSKLAQEILSGPLFPHVETCTRFRAWTPAATLGILRKDMISNAYRLVIPPKETPMNLDNPELKIFCKLTAEEQKALLELPYNQVEEYLSNDTWIGNSIGKPLRNVGVYRQKPVPKPQWIDIAPNLRSTTNLWKITTPERSSILLTDAPSHARFIGFVYGENVYALLQYNNTTDHTKPPVLIPDAVRFQQ